MDKLMSDLRLRLETADGCLVANQKILHPEFYFTRWGFDGEFALYVLTRVCQEKGVILVSYSADKETGILAKVKWA